MVYGGGPPMGGHGGSDFPGSKGEGWLSGSCGSSGSRKKRSLGPWLWVALALLIIAVYLLFG